MRRRAWLLGAFLLGLLLRPSMAAAQGREREDEDDQLLDVAELFHKRGEHDKAIAIYDEILERRPDDPQALTKLAAACLSSAACAPRRGAVLQAAVRVLPDDAELLEELAEVLGQAGRHRVAVRALRGYLRRHPADDTIRAALVDNLVAARDFRAALPELRIRLQRSPGDRAARWMEIELLDALGRTPERDRALAAYVKLDPTSGDAWVELGERAVDRQELARAEEAVRRARAGRFRDEKEGRARLAALERDLAIERAEQLKDRAEQARDLRRDARWADLVEEVEQGDDY
jgi:tetratricopeptide (TPR) repeat protein